MLERNDDYWGPKPKIKRVTFEIIKDPSARVAAMQSGQVDLTINVPVREVERLQQEPSLAAELNPITRVILLQVRNDLGFADHERAARRAPRDRQGGAVEGVLRRRRGAAVGGRRRPARPAISTDFTVRVRSGTGEAAAGEIRLRPDKPAKIGFAATNGQFPSDYDIARAIVQMWKKVGIEAELEVIEYAKYFELNRGAKLPEATLYSWDNATGDPEIFAGYLLNPKMPFSAWKDMDVGAEGDRPVQRGRLQEAHRRLTARSTAIAVESGATIPLLQSVQTRRAQEEADVREIRQRLGAAADDGVES